MIILRLVLLGPPGAGKGTQASEITKRYDIPHISTGDIFRDNIKRGTDLGKKAKKYLDNGSLVPDDIVVSIVKDRLAEDDCEDGFLLDGFPRTVNQAHALEDALNEMKIKLDNVINIDVAKEVLINRAIGRRICKDCGATYHIEFNPPREDSKCDVCGGALYQRDDDTEETVARRIAVYSKQTKPLIDYYSKKGIIINVDGKQSIESVFEDIVKSLG